MRVGYRSASSLRRPERKRRNRRLLAGLLALLLAAAAAPFLAKPAARALGRFAWFQVRRIEIVGCAGLDPETVRRSIPVDPGANLLLIPLERIADAVRKNARVESVRVSRSPGTLHIHLRERRTLALVAAGRLLEVDSTGLILPPLPAGAVPDRPVLTGFSLSGRKPGSRVTSPRLLHVLRLVRELESPEVGLLPELSEIAAAGGRDVTLRTARDQIPILVDPLRATPASLKALAATLHDLRERRQVVLEVDARFRGQVVVRCAPDSLRAASEERDKV
jgi:hypothetical protein